MGRQPGRPDLHLQAEAGRNFESGKPVTAQDVAFSLQRVVKLNKTPGFIITQFGFTKDNVEELIRARTTHAGDAAAEVPRRTSFVLYCLSANVGCIVERRR